MARKIKSILKMKDVEGNEHSLEDQYLIHLLEVALNTKGKERKKKVKQINLALGNHFYTTFNFS